MDSSVMRHTLYTVIQTKGQGTARHQKGLILLLVVLDTSVEVDPMLITRALLHHKTEGAIFIHALHLDIGILSSLLLEGLGIGSRWWF